MSRRAALALVATLGIILACESIALPCKGARAKALQADAKRATQWNWGWGATLGVSALVFGGLAYRTEDDSRRLAFGLTAVKSTLGTLNQIVLPIRIESPKEGCAELEIQVKNALRVERKRHNWFAHATGIVLNIAGFAYIGYATDDWLLATRSSVLGIATGELIIYTSPNRVRSGGFGVSDVTVLPLVGQGLSGVSLGGRF